MDEGGYLDELRRACLFYCSEMDRLAQGRKGFSIFGLGSKLGDDPCNRVFSRDVEQLMEEMAQDEDAASEEIRECLEYLYHLPMEHKRPAAAHWMLRAVQNFTLPLAERLSPSDAAAVRARYEKDYPKRDRLPVQEKLLAALQRAEEA